MMQHRHLISAEQLADDDPAGAFQMAYDASRTACSALLAAQGLRATSRGGHIAVRDVALAQFGHGSHGRQGPTGPAGFLIVLINAESGHVMYGFSR
jgi:hypothetical protein